MYSKLKGRNVSALRVSWLIRPFRDEKGRRWFSRISSSSWLVSVTDGSAVLTSSSISSLIASAVAAAEEANLFVGYCVRRASLIEDEVDDRAGVAEVNNDRELANRVAGTTADLATAETADGHADRERRKRLGIMIADGWVIVYLQISSFDDLLEYTLSVINFE